MDLFDASHPGSLSRREEVSRAIARDCGSMSRGVEPLSTVRPRWTNACAKATSRSS